MARKKEIPAAHPLESWFIDRARAWEDGIGPRTFDERNLAGWLGADAGGAWGAYKKVALHLLKVCEARGIIERDRQGWYRLVPPRA